MSPRWRTVLAFVFVLSMVGSASWFVWKLAIASFDWSPVGGFLSALAGYISLEISRAKDENEARKLLVHPSKHDVELFGAFVDLSPSSGSVELLRDFDFGNTFRWEDVQPFNTFNYEWDNEEHKFDDEVLESARSTLLQKVGQFCEHVAQYTAPSRSGEGLQSVRPYHQEWDDRLREEARLINKSARDAYGAHQSFVRLARKLLRRSASEG